MMRSPKSERRITRPPNRNIEDSPPKIKKRASPSRSPARTRRSSPRSSPSRKSPSRKQTKIPRKSPSRTAKKDDKSPARTAKKEEKSPSRITKKEDKSPLRSDKKVEKSPKKSVIKIELERGEADLKSELTRRSRRSEFSVKDLTGNIKQIETSVSDRLNGIQTSIKERLGIRERKSQEFIPRRSSRLQELSSSEKGSSVSSRRGDTDEEFSEDDGFTKRKSSSRKLLTPLPELSFSKLLRGTKEFGGTIGSVILMVLIPVTVFYIIASCKGSCALRNTPDINLYKNSNVWFSTKSWLLITSQIIIQGLITLLPICSKVQSEQYTFRSNGIIGFLVSYIILSVLDHLKILDIKFILAEYYHLAVASYIIGVLAAFGAYWKAWRGHGELDNKYGNTGSMIYDFWLGRQLHPIIFKRLSLKLWLRRVSVINALILSIVIFVQGFHLPKGLELSLNMTDVHKIANTVPSIYKNWTLFTISLIQIVYFLDLILSERRIITTFFWQYEAVGYLYTVCSGLYPFFALVISKNILEQNIQVSWNILAASITLSLLGFTLYKFSNNIKHQFRENPGKLYKMETMPTFHGQKLLLGGTWGFLRHPNYLGDILIHIGLVLPAAVSGPTVPIIVAVITTLILLHRVSRDNTRCSKVYGAAWQRYRAKVPSAIIPKIY